MPEQIHGHEVMEMMVASGRSYTKETLAKDIVEKFGADARFFTCSAENMTAEQLIAFLEQRGKFTPRNQGFSVDPTHICSHEDGEAHGV